MIERGAIYSVETPGDPRQRPVPLAVVSTDIRNRYGRDVLVIPLSASPKRYETHLELAPGETGLPHASVAKCEQIGVVTNQVLGGRSPVSPRRSPEARIRQMADLAALAMGVKR